MLLVCGRLHCVLVKIWLFSIRLYIYSSSRQGIIEIIDKLLVVILSISMKISAFHKIKTVTESPLHKFQIWKTYLLQLATRLC